MDILPYQAVYFWISLVTGMGFLFMKISSPERPQILRIVLGIFCLWTALRLAARDVFTPVFLDTGQAIAAVFCALLLSYQTVCAGLSRIAAWWRLRRKFGLPVYLAEIVKTVDILASKKIGALIVLERKNDLSEYLPKGFLFDAQVKSEILISIFSPESPVHDGAIVVRKGRICAVKVILPLATEAAVPMGVGTRHRSAIGVTEKKDAVALVVSEERGEVSLAIRGRLMRNLPPKDFDRVLLRAMRGKDPGFSPQ